jgi:WYL domain
MAKKLTPHPYTDKLAFDRLLLLISTLVQYPGVGYSDSDSANGNALETVQQRLREVAAAMGIEFPEGYPAIPTIRKDMETLRHYGILDKRMYRWGYYLGTGALNREELQVAFNALASQAKYQGNPQARRIYTTVAKRLRGFDLELKGEFFYPVRQHLNRAIVYTDPDEMAERGEYRNTLFHQLDIVEQAIVQGQAIEVYRNSDPYGRKRVGMMRVWPLQLIYYDRAWYLIYEYCENGLLAISRVNRFSDYCQFISLPARGLTAQEQSLQKAHKLLENGWGLYLGELEEQQSELQGKLPFEKVKVRFFGSVMAFILEGDRRHPRQKIRPGKKDAVTGDLTYVDYQVMLPPRALKEFILWVFKHANHAQVLSPPSLVEQHREAMRAAAARYL